MAAISRQRFRADLPRRAPGVLLALALAIACLTRLPWVTNAGFPLNDGGLFFIMARDLQANHFALPLETTFNAAHLPFAYPPLGIYLVAALQSLTQVPLEAIFIALPVCLSLVSIVVFNRFSKTILPAPSAYGAATFAFVLMPTAYVWQIMGGGVTRALGQLFMLLSLWQGYETFQTKNAKQAVLTGVFGAVTVLSHPEAGWFLAQSLALLWLFYGRTRRGTILAGLIALLVALLSAPWWATLIARYGPGIFGVAGQAGWPLSDALLQLFVFGNVTGERLIPFVAFFALLGTAVCLARRRYFLPVWLLISFLVQPRAADQKAAIILALLVGAAAELVLALPVMRSKAVVLALTLYAVVATSVSAATPLQALSQDERAAMAWTKSNTPAGSAFVVMAADAFWGFNRSAEWFPAMTERPNLALVQGYEWSERGAFAGRMAAYQELNKCLSVGADCVDGWMRSHARGASYLYMPKRPAAEDAVGPQVGSPCCQSLIDALRADRRFAVAFDGSGAVIFARREAQ